MSYSDLPPLPKSLAAAVLPEGVGFTNIETPSTSTSTRTAPQRETSEEPIRHGSLSSTAESISSGDASKSPTVSSTGTTSNESNMDTQLATLRQEMHNLRQMDLSLLTQLWALNESIQGFRARLEDRKTPRSPSPPRSFGSEGENDFESRLHTQSKEYFSSTSRLHTHGNRVIQPTLIEANPNNDSVRLNANHYSEKVVRKPRPKKNLYDYPYEENQLKSEMIYHQSNSCARASNTIPQQSQYSKNDLPLYPIAKAHTIQAGGGVVFHQQLMQSHQPHMNHNKLHPVQWAPPVNAQPKSSKGAIPKILSILQRKQRAPPPPPPPLHKSSQRPV